MPEVPPDGALLDARRAHNVQMALLIALRFADPFVDSFSDQKALRCADLKKDAVAPHPVAPSD